MSSSISSSRRAIRIYAAAVGASLAIAAGATEALLRTQVAPQDNFARHLALLRTTDARDAAFGDSHVARGFAAEAPMVNLAYPSETIERFAWKAKAYFARLTPGRVIVQADPHLFTPYRLADGLGDYPERIAKAPGAARLLILADHHRDRIPAYWRAFLVSGGRLASSIEFSERGTLLSGGDLSAVPGRKRAYDARARVALHRPIAQFRDTGEARAYESLLDFLFERGAEICLVTFPLSPDYRATLAEDREAEAFRTWRDLIAYFREQAERVKARYVDASAAVADAGLYRDVDHLNRAGALAYSPRLMEDCFGTAAEERTVRRARPKR